MIVVADTSPLNYLIRLGQAAQLRDLYQRVLVPPAVLNEMQHPDAPSEVRSWAIAPPAWLEPRNVQQLDSSLAVELGMGEREAISLALQLNADVLLIDERAGRHEAEMRQIAVTGTLAVLLQAALQDRLSLADTLAQLCRFGFRASPRLQAEMLARYEQARKERP